MWIMILPLVVMTIVLLVDIKEEIQGGVSIACVVILLWVLQSVSVLCRGSSSPKSYLLAFAQNATVCLSPQLLSIFLSPYSHWLRSKIGRRWSDDQKKRCCDIVRYLCPHHGIGSVCVRLWRKRDLHNNNISRFQQQRILCWTNGKGDDNGEVIDLLDNRHRRQSSDGEPLEF